MKILFSLIISFFAISAILIWQFFEAKNNDFKLVFCDVGQGDGIYMRAFGEDIVIDGGPEGGDSTISDCLGAHMPLFDRNIELMVVTHADSDHYAGFLELLNSYTVTNFATSHGDSDVLGYQALLNKLANQGIEPRRLSQGDRIKINDELKIDILWPPTEFTDIDDDRNNSSLVFMVDYNDFEAVLTGDLDKEYLNLLLHDLSQIEVFKTSHHGSNTGTDENTFESIRPELSIISAGRDNRFGHPHREVIETLNRFDLKYLSTQDGDVVIKSDGKNWEVED